MAYWFTGPVFFSNPSDRNHYQNKCLFRRIKWNIIPKCFWIMGTIFGLFDCSPTKEDEKIWEMLWQFISSLCIADRFILSFTFHWTFWNISIHSLAMTFNCWFSTNDHFFVSFFFINGQNQSVSWSLGCNFLLNQLMKRSANNCFVSLWSIRILLNEI